MVFFHCVHSAASDQVHGLYLYGRKLEKGRHFTKDKFIRQCILKVYITCMRQNTLVKKLDLLGQVKVK